MQEYSVAQIGRIAGLAIIGVGFVMALWGAVDLDHVGGDDRFRFFVEDTLSWIALGGLVYLGSEILDKVTAKNG